MGTLTIFANIATRSGDRGYFGPQLMANDDSKFVVEATSTGWMVKPSTLDPKWELYIAWTAINFKQVEWHVSCVYKLVGIQSVSGKSMRKFVNQDVFKAIKLLGSELFPYEDRLNPGTFKIARAALDLRIKTEYEKALRAKAKLKQKLTPSIKKTLSRFSVQDYESSELAWELVPLQVGDYTISIEKRPSPYKFAVVLRSGDSKTPPLSEVMSLAKLDAGFTAARLMLQAAAITDAQKAYKAGAARKKVKKQK